MRCVVLRATRTRHTNMARVRDAGTSRERAPTQRSHTARHVTKPVCWGVCELLVAVHSAVGVK
eukprot:7379353-Prymnesium_polylepis.1